MPKPLIPVGGKPLIQWHLEKLSRAGIREVVINHAWLGSMIEHTLGTGKDFGLDIQYSREPAALETAGGIATALPLLGDQPFLVLNGDIWCDWDPTLASTLASNLIRQQGLAWLLMVPNPPHHPAGDFVLDAQGFLHDQMTSAESTPRRTFAGIGIYQPVLFKKTPAHQPAKLAPLLRSAMKTNQVLGALHSTEWIDVGTLERLALLEGKIANIQCKK
jgi:MurNAc alpha-1-phosphate uridylyltransferase